MKKYIHEESKQYFAFNIWSVESAKAVIDAAETVNTDVILQTSLKAYKELDKKEIRQFVTSYTRDKTISVYLHLDHCRDIKIIEDAIAYGWDSVMIDASDKSIEYNIDITNQVTEIAKKNDILVEAEVGQIAGENGVADIEDVKQFIEKTSIDMLAVAIGTSHGLYKGVPKLSYSLLDEVAKYTTMPLVIHGGTGLSDEMFTRLLQHEHVKKINISTDIKQAYRRGIMNCIEKKWMEKEDFDPNRVVRSIHDQIYETAMSKMSLLRG